MDEYRLVVLTNAAAGEDDAYNAWYDGEHLDDVLSVEGFTRAQRFELADVQVTPAPIAHRYLAIYAFESDDLAATVARFLEVCATRMRIAGSLAPDALPMVFRVRGAEKVAG